MKTDGQKRRLKTPLIFIVIFALPVVLAKLALDQGWFNYASTNRGELINPPISLEGAANNLEQKWHLLYVLPQKCEQDCQNAIYSLNQVWLALGREMDRVQPTVIHTAKSDTEALTSLGDNPNVRLLLLDDQNVNKVFEGASLDGMFLSDTLGNVILRYPLSEEKQQAVLTSRDMLADLKKLLKLSRIG